MEMDYLKFVIVGHIDHGKSTLIGRLLYDTDSLPEGKIEEIREVCDALGKDLEFGYVMDHLEEERDQGITIDTAQIFFDSEKRNYVIIDAPGHVEFVKNMITGASQAEAAILIVDADEGVKEQTRRHAYILSLLGLSQVMVVINKMDLVEYSHERFEEVKSDITQFLNSIGISPSYIVPISAKEGDFVSNRTDNMPWYQGVTALEGLDAFESRPSSMNRPLRFVVQDVVNPGKRIIVGRVESGLLRPGQEVVLLPSMERTQIGSLEEFQADPEEAEPGKAIGLTTKDKVFVDRGNVISDPEDMPQVTDEIRGNVFWMDPQPYGKGDALFFRCGTQEVPCTLERIHTLLDSSSLEIISEDADEIGNREVADVTIRTDKPVVVENFMETQEIG
ncbi:MAG: sulfate adenylyltransferase subunit 1, partial [Methanomassiliicoccales archaeon]